MQPNRLFSFLNQSYRHLPVNVCHINSHIVAGHYFRMSIFKSILFPAAPDGMPHDIDWAADVAISFKTAWDRGSARIFRTNFCANRTSNFQARHRIPSLQQQNPIVHFASIGCPTCVKANSHARVRFSLPPDRRLENDKKNKHWHLSLYLLWQYTEDLSGDYRFL